MFKKTHYTNGQKVFAFDGDQLTYYYKNGVTKARGKFINDRMEDEWIFYRENGSLWQIGHFLNNQKHGEWIRYNKQGEVEYHETFKMGKKQ